MQTIRLANPVRGLKMNFGVGDSLEYIRLLYRLKTVNNNRTYLHVLIPRINYKATSLREKNGNNETEKF